jgi:hypothetical protein
VTAPNRCSHARTLISKDDAASKGASESIVTSTLTLGPLEFSSLTEMPGLTFSMGVDRALT